MATSDSTPIQLPLAIDGLTIEIPLTKGYVAIVDAIDADLLQFNWRISIGKSGKYAKRTLKDKSLYMHRLVFARMIGRELLTSERVDHRDCNSMNNRRENLRLCTGSQNIFNSRKSKSNTSGYKGVVLHKNSGKWAAQIGYCRRNIHLGMFDTPEEAHESYCKAARELAGEFARLE